MKQPDAVVELVKPDSFISRLSPARWHTLPEVMYPLIGLILVCGVMSMTSRYFLSAENGMMILRQVSINLIMAIGMTFVILTGGIDLSVGSIMALVGTLISGLLVANVNPVLAIAAGFGAGLLAGLVNGALVSLFNMPSIIVTLATMGIARGLALIYSKGYPIDGLPNWFAWVGQGSIMGWDIPVLICVVMYLLAWVVLKFTPFGRYVYAIGGNETATRLSGVNVRRYKWAVYAVSGLTAALAGFILSSRLMSGQPSAGSGFELDAIAAVVMGGTAIAGGQGSIIGTALGAILLGVINSGLNMTGVSPYMQLVIRGAIILLAVVISRKRVRWA
jgi:ribose transport system permease protein